MDREEVQAHSKIAFEKWKELWLKNCDLNKNKIKTSLKDAVDLYKGKKAVLFAFGPSFKRNVEEFKSSKLFNDPDVVVGCVDKSFRPLVNLGVYPDFVLIADGSVSTEYLEGVSPDAIKKARLISNVYASPGWAEKWAKISGAENIWWYLNKDNIEIKPGSKVGTAELFGPYVGYYDVIEAASNVGNGLVVFCFKIFGIKEVYLCAYDYSWDYDNYYGVDNQISRKKMSLYAHLRPLDINCNLAFASTNMDFSSRWLDGYFDYVRMLYGGTVFNCTGAGMLKKGIKLKINSTHI